MDKNAIKKYAVWARNELIARVTQKAEQYEITEKKTTSADADSIGGRLLTDAEKKQRAALIEKIKADGFEQAMEEVAYTWFNRFTALRFMEVNNYLPSHTRVFTNEAGEFKPQILADAIQLELDGLDMDKVFELKDANKTEELYKYLLITQCNALSGILPRMFQKIEHYTELLLPDYLLREGSVIEQMITLIPEEDWTDQVQIIGWLYQYYNIEPKAKVFSRKGGEKIKKEEIPAATQLFTPDWIVRYMVENSLGRLWLEGHPNDALKSEWKYYLDEVEQEAEVQKQLDEIQKGYVEMKPEEIRCIDPCMGSGHILCYMFDVLVKIYEDYGYTAREAVGNIVEKNLWGLDIDERAAQLSYFAVMMKARQYDRRFFARGIQPCVFAIIESNGITSAPMHDMGIELSQDEYSIAVKQAMRLIEEFRDAKEFGSLIQVTPCDWDLLRRFAVPRGVSEGQLRLDIHGEVKSSERLQKLINIGEALSQKYDVFCTNPPYMGNKGMNDTLSGFLQNHYPHTKYDLFAAFIERGINMTANKKYLAMITQNSWMAGSRYENARKDFFSNSIVNMVHLGTRAFDEIGGEVVQTVAFCMGKNYPTSQIGTYVKLTDVAGEKEKEQAFFEGTSVYHQQIDTFKKMPSYIIGYWVNQKVLDCLQNEKPIEEGIFFRQGMATSDNNRFLKSWQEVSVDRIGFDIRDREEAQQSRLRWFPYNKGGSFRKWYGNNELVVNWENDGAEMKAFTATLPQGTDVRLKSKEYYFKEGFTWSALATSVSVRYCQPGFIFDTKGSMGFPYKESLIKYFTGLINSSVSKLFLQVLAPTLDFNLVSMKQIPMKIDRVEEVTKLVDECIEIAKRDWDSFEVSWDFKHHPLIGDYKRISEAFENWASQKAEDFVRLQQCETQLNNIFANIYRLEDVVDCDVDENDITIRKADLSRDIKSLLSYAVGCIFGRYSLDQEGLVFAGYDWDLSKYKRIIPNKDGIIPICDDEYFEDDIVGLIVQFITVAYGADYLEENLRYIADALGGKGSPREVIRSYFINDFYKDHCADYQTQAMGKRPIYWLFDSGKKNGFKCLVYMHRYQADTIARIRTDYVHEQQSRYRTAIGDLENRITGAGTSERVKLNKQLSILQDQATEIREYEEKIHHLADQMISIDLDDGVKHNYEIFKDVLAKIK